MEQPIISGVAHDRSEAKITVVGVPDVPGKAARIFGVVAGRRREHRHDRAERVRRRDRPHRHLVHAAGDATARSRSRPSPRRRAGVGFHSLQYDDTIGKLSLVGAGMRSHPGVSAKLFDALSDAGINIEMISTSEIRISVVTRADHLDDAVRAVHTAFELDSAEDEAVVYGGTGR